MATRNFKICTLMIQMLLAYNSTIVFNCNTSTSSSLELKKGTKLKLCIHFLPYGIKAAFDVEVDKFSGITVTRGYDALSKFDTDIAVQIENFTTMSNLSVS